MYVGRDFSEMDEGEVETFTLDFVVDLKTDTIVSSNWAITVAPRACAPGHRADVDPSSHLVGDAVVSGTKSSQKISGLMAGNTYVLRANVVTNTGQTLSLWSHVVCVRPV